MPSFLAERFASPDFRIFYERSALQAGDIYTKHCVSGAEWEVVAKLINHLHPDHFWKGPTKSGYKPLMFDEHKGGVRYGCLCSNPWTANPDRNIAEHVNASCVGGRCPSIRLVRARCS